MVDKTKWKSVICYPETQEKVQDLANLYEIPMCHVLRNIVDQVWAREFVVNKNSNVVNPQPNYKVFKSKA